MHLTSTVKSQEKNKTSVFNSLKNTVFVPSISIYLIHLVNFHSHKFSKKFILFQIDRILDTFFNSTFKYMYKFYLVNILSVSMVSGVIKER